MQDNQDPTPPLNNQINQEHLSLKKQSKQLLNQSINGLNKEQLEDLKLQAELLKVRHEIKEKNQPWLIRNMLSLFPSLIAIATIIAGLVTGFFNIERINFKKDIDSLTLRKNSLVQVNHGLDSTNNQLKKIQENLLFETYQLKNDTALLSHNLDSSIKMSGNLVKDKFLLSKQVSLLRNEINKLQRDKEEISKSITGLRREIKQFAFDEYLKSITEPDNKNSYYSNSYYNSLVGLLKYETELHTNYIQAINKSIKSTKNIRIKLKLMRLMYDYSGDINWRNKVFNVVDFYCDTITKTYFNNDIYTILYILKFTQSDENIVAKFMASLAVKNYDKDFLVIKLIVWLSSTNNLQNLIGQKDFCLLLHKSKTFFLGQNSEDRDDSIIYDFVEVNAPIIYVCLASELLTMDVSGPFSYIHKRKSFLRTEIMNVALAIIDKNPTVFSRPNSLMEKGWEEWRSKYFNLIKFVYSGKYCDNPNDFKKVIGNRR